MQTLNVGAGQTDHEYKEAEQQRLADLRADSQNASSYFFWAAGLAALGTGLLPVRMSFLFNIGMIDLLNFYGRSTGSFHGRGGMVAAAMWVILVALLGLAGRSGERWAFLAGMLLYGADMIALTMMFSMWAFGVHAFFLFKWFEGQKALKELRFAAG